MNDLSRHAVAADSRHDLSRVIRAPRGSAITCKNWLIEAAYRMIQNNLDCDVAERPQGLVVYGGIGRAARDWQCFDAILVAAAERDVECVQRRDVVLDSPWWQRRDGVFATCGGGDCLRWFFCGWQED